MLSCFKKYKYILIIKSFYLNTFKISIYCIFLYAYACVYTYAPVKNGIMEERSLQNSVYDLIPTVQNKQPFFSAPSQEGGVLGSICFAAASR